MWKHHETFFKEILHKFFFLVFLSHFKSNNFLLDQSASKLVNSKEVGPQVHKWSGGGGVMFANKSHDQVCHAPCSGCWDDTGKAPNTVPDPRQMFHKCQLSSAPSACPFASAKVNAAPPCLAFYMLLSFMLPLLQSTTVHPSRPAQNLSSSRRETQIT